MAEFDAFAAYPADRWLDAHLGDADVGLPPLPDESMQQNRHNSSGEAALRSGFAIYTTLLECIGDYGVDLQRPGAAVLDFGCGWGRVLRFFARDLPPSRLHGTDAKADGIEFARTTNPLATFHHNAPQPPLAFADAAFDLVYAWSVFSHFSEHAHRRWLKELRRVARPGGLVVLSVRPRGFIQHIERRRQRQPDDVSFPHRATFVDVRNALSSYDAGEYCFHSYGSHSPDWGEAVIPASDSGRMTLTSVRSFA